MTASEPYHPTQSGHFAVTQYACLFPVDLEIKRGLSSFHCRMGIKWHDTELKSMSKERKLNKEVKKQPTVTPKERKAAKKAKKSQYR